MYGRKKKNNGIRAKHTQWVSLLIIYLASVRAFKQDIYKCFSRSIQVPLIPPNFSRIKEGGMEWKSCGINCHLIWLTRHVALRKTTVCLRFTFQKWENIFASSLWPHNNKVIHCINMMICHHFYFPILSRLFYPDECTPEVLIFSLSI